MSEKEYLEKLKEEDYIAWDQLVNDPMVTGTSSGSSTTLFLTIIVIVGVIIYIL